MVVPRMIGELPQCLELHLVLLRQALLTKSEASASRRLYDDSPSMFGAGVR